jgi:hypothetical protein
MSEWHNFSQKLPIDGKLFCMKYGMSQYEYPEIRFAHNGRLYYFWGKLWHRGGYNLNFYESRGEFQWMIYHQKKPKIRI